MSFGFTFVFIISKYKMENEDETNYYLFPFIIAGIISITNFLLKIVLEYSTSWEYRESYSY